MIPVFLPALARVYSCHTEVSAVDDFEEKVRMIVTMGIGAVISGIEKSREAVVAFTQSELARELSRRGEDAVRTAAEAGGKAAETVKKAFQDAGARAQEERLEALAREIRRLSPEQRARVHAMVSQTDEGEDEETPAPPPPDQGVEGEGIGKPGVTESAFDLEPAGHGEEAAKDPLSSPTHTAPDDDLDVRRSQTNNMNEHLKQNVPPDF